MCYPDLVPDITISLIPVTDDDEALLAAWFKGDAEGLLHVGSYRDVRAWRRLMSGARHGWIAIQDGLPVGFLDLEMNGRTGHFSYYIAPDVRRRGLGVAVLVGLQNRCAELGLTRVVGYVEPTNVASLATLRRAGFTIADHLDDDGMLEVSKPLPGQ